MSYATTIREQIEQTPFVDTHEHLIEEKRRIESDIDGRLFPCDDWSLLLFHYLGDDLTSAGMSADSRKRFFSPETPSEEKWQIVAPYWERTKHTGYAQSVRHTLRMLYDENDLTEESVPRLAEKYRDVVRPGFYAHVLQEKANVTNCHVNSLERIFMETARPQLLRQDLSIVALSTGLNRAQVEQESGKTADTLEGWLEVIDWHFATYAPNAVAVKNQNAYSRRLNYEPATLEQAAPLFSRHAKGETLSPDEEKTLQDFLMRYCVGKATEYNLPIKLHTGYYAGHSYMPLSRVQPNAGDLCPLLNEFRDARFVLMHIGYPYQDE